MGGLQVSRGNDKFNNALLVLNQCLSPGVELAEELCRDDPNSKASIASRYRIEGNELKVDPRGLFSWLRSKEEKIGRGEILNDAETRATKKLAFVLRQIIKAENLGYSLQDLNIATRELIAASVEVKVERKNFAPFTQRQILAKESVTYIVSALGQLAAERGGPVDVRPRARQGVVTEIVATRAKPPVYEQGLLFRLPEPRQR